MRFLALLPLLAGCMARATGGYVREIGDDSPGQGVLLSAHLDAGHPPETGVTYGGALRMKVGPDLKSAGVAVEAGLPGMPEFFGPVSFTAYGGLHVFQLDQVDGRTRFGMGSPYLSAGPSFCYWDDVDNEPDGILCLSFVGEADYHLRFGAPDAAYWGLGLNVSARLGAFD